MIFPEYFYFSFPSIQNVRCLFTTAQAGNLSLDAAKNAEERSAVINSRAKIIENNQLAGWAECYQVHKDDMVLEAEAVDWRKPPEVNADGLATAKDNLGLVIKTADCQPVLIAHKTGQCVAALHVGWRGNTIEFIESAVDKFCHKYAVLPCDIFAVRGPSLGSPRAEFVNFKQEWPAKFSPWFDEAEKVVDLWGLSRYQLVRAGIPAKQIFSLDFCTYSLSPNFFSHRQGQTGRQLSIIWKK